MARFSNLSVAGPTATHRLLQHKPTCGHSFELLILAAATGAKTPTAPLLFTRRLATTNDQAREASIAFTCDGSDPTDGHLAAAQSAKAERLRAKAASAFVRTQSPPRLQLVHPLS